MFRQFQGVEARLEEESRRHKEAEALWKEAQQRFMATEARLKEEVESLRGGKEAAEISPQATEQKIHDPDFANKARNRIQLGMHRRDDEFLMNFFQHKVKNSGTSVLSNEQFTSALDELGLRLKEDEIQSMFRFMDVNSDGVLDLEEFTRAVRFPSAIEQLISTLPITQVFTDAVLAMTGIDHLRQFSHITPKQIEDICTVVIPFVKKLLEDSAKKTRELFEAMDKSEASSSAKKFEVPPEMSAGTVDDFHKGLAGRIGMLH